MKERMVDLKNLTELMLENRFNEHTEYTLLVPQKPNKYNGGNLNE